MAASVKWLLNELHDARTLADSVKTAEKSRVASIKAEAGRRFQKCYDHFTYMNTAVHTQRRRFQDHAELVVTVAEVAFLTERVDTAREVVQAYFDEQPQKDQFLCRAKLLLAMIIDFEATAASANGCHSIEKRQEALGYLMEALDVASDVELNGSRYNFLVFNCSLTCWTIVSPFLRATRARPFLKEMCRISAALEKIDDADKSWRIKFLAAAALCCSDDKNVKESSDLLDKAISHAEAMLNGTLEVEKGILAEVSAAKVESESIISAIRAVEDREEQALRPPKIDPDLPEGQQEESKPELAPLEGLAAEGAAVLKEKLNESSSVKSIADEKLKVSNGIRDKETDVLSRLYMQRVHSNPGDAKKVQGLPIVLGSLRIKSLVTLQCLASGVVAEKDVEPTFAALVKELFEADQNAAVVETVCDVSRMAWRFEMSELAIECASKAELTTAVSPAIRVKLDLCKALRTVSDAVKQSANKEIGQRLSDKQLEGFNVSRRIEALRLLERTLTMATARLEDNSLVEEICVAIWNTALPLLQPHLRANVHHSFHLAAEALATGSSALTGLRAALHFELCKCEEQADFVLKAKVEGEHAKSSDYGTLDESLVAAAADTGLDRNRPLDHLIRPFVEVLHLRSNVYGAPEDVESQVLLLLQQIKESTSQQFQKEMLSKGAALMFAALYPPAPAGEAVEGEVAVLTDSELSLEAVEEAVNIKRDGDFTTFTELTQRRCSIMSSLAQVAHGQRNVRVLQWAAKYVLSHSWDSADPFMRHLLDRQVDMHFILADSLVERLSGLWITPESEKELDADSELLEDGAPDIPGPRTLGVNSKYCTPEMNDCKRLVPLCLTRGIALSALIKDEFGTQNGIIYFWNLHLPAFRHELFKSVSDDVFEFLKMAIATMDALPPTPSSVGRPTQIDGGLRTSVINNLALLHEARNELPQGIECSNKGANDTKTNVYHRRKLVETANRLATLVSLGGGGKGGKAPDAPKFDHPLLNAYALLSQAELPTGTMPAEQVKGLADKALEVMTVELTTWLEAQAWDDMTQEAYDEVMEMQAECWTRLTRVRIVLGDVHASQSTAEKCMQLVDSEHIKKTDEKKLSPRVWRWLSVCERYFGLAILQVIDPVGMDESLQNELSLACLRHFNISCKYALRASREDLLVASAISAWNGSMHLVSQTTVRPSLLFLQREVVDALLTCRGDNDDAMRLRQQFYLAMVEERALSREWDEAQALVFEAFDNVPASLQKPLWKWRVIVLSKKGKNVLDGIQKLKEGDASLQARVYAILARASSNPKQQIEAYKKTIEILSENMERVDYTLETAQWMASAGVPRVEISEVVHSAMDAMYEVEERKLSDRAAGEGKDGDDQSATSSQSGASSRKSARSASSRASASASRAGTRAGGSRASRSRGSRAGPRAIEEEPGTPDELNIKHLEQAVRSLAMLGMLSSDEQGRQEQCVEAMYFVKQFFALWQKSLYAAAKIAAYFKQTPAEREQTKLEDYVCPEEAQEGLSLPSGDPLAMLAWVPSENFTRVMAAAQEELPRGVPSAMLLQNLPLTLHYALWVAQTLEGFGFPKHALTMLAWVRAIFCVVPELEQREAAFAMLHYRAIAVMMRCGLSDLVEGLPLQLGTCTSSCLHFLGSFGSKLVDPAGVPTREVIPSEELTVFGFSSWTQALEGVDESLCGLEICSDLMSLGQTSQCRALAEVIRRDFLIKQDQRSLLRVAAVLCELDLLAGRTDDALTTMLSSSADMAEAGDGTLLARHVRVAVAGYVRAGQADEARRVALDAIATLTTFANMSVSKGAQAGGDSISRGGSRSASRSLTTAGTRGASGGRVQAIAQFECSFEVVEALAGVVFQYVDLLVQEAADVAFNGGDARPQLAEVRKQLSAAQEIAVTVCGATSSLVARILEYASQATCTVLSLLSRYAPLSAMGEDERDGWVRESYAGALEALGRCVDIRRGLLSRVSFEEQNYLPSAAPKKKEEVVDPKAKKGKAPVEEEVPAAPEPRLLSTHLARITAMSELQLAEQNMMFARLNGDHLTVVPLEPDAEPTVIESFLSSTKQPVPFDPQDFSVPRIMQGAHLASSAAQLLDNTDSESFGALLHTNAGLMRLCGNGAFDRMWRKPRPVFVEKVVAAEEEGQEETKVMEEQEPEPITLSEEALQVRDKLIAQVPDALQERRFTQMQLSAATLADSFGCLGEGPQSSICWVMLMQSIAAREWLLQNWVSALNPSGDIATSLRRLQELEAAQYPSKASQPQIGVELAFLQNVSPAWRRLNIEADPAGILGKMSAGQAVLCLQMCPTQNTLYLAAGIPGGASDTAFKAEGTWSMTKMDLCERDRRLLLTLVQQQRKWNEDAAHFVALFGEEVTSEQDLQGHEAAFGSKVMKYERALEERMRALLVDLEQILEPVLGEKAAFREFLRSLRPDDESLGLLLLLDPALQDLPFEGLSVAANFGGQVSRDFSLHLHGHRLSTFEGAQVEAVAVKKVTDPCEDDIGSTLAGYERESITQVLDHLKSEAAGSDKWQHLATPGQGSLSTQDWISQFEYGQSVSSIFLFAPGRLGSLLSPQDVAVLNFEKTLLVVCSDQGLNDASFRRQNSLDNAKTPKDVGLESPVRMLANLSLGGCGSVVGSQWATTLAAQGRMVRRFWQAFTQDNQPVAAAVAHANGLGSLEESDALHGKALKPWVRLGRVSYGLPVTYKN